MKSLPSTKLIKPEKRPYLSSSMISYYFEAMLVYWRVRRSSSPPFLIIDHQTRRTLMISSTKTQNVVTQLVVAKAQGRWISEKVVSLWLSICLSWWSAHPTRECLLDRKKTHKKRDKCFNAVKPRLEEICFWFLITVVAQRKPQRNNITIP